MGTTTNRTYWPTLGGAIAFQPGWFQGHNTAFLYINLGFGTDGPDNGPMNMSFPMVSPFQLLGPSKNPYPGTVCLPQVPLPANTVVNPGDKATIQIVELAQHGASLFSVSFILLSLPTTARGTPAFRKDLGRLTSVLQCVDIEFVAPGDSRLAPVNETNCFNSTDLGFAQIYTVTTTEIGATNASATSGALATVARSGASWLGYAPLVLGAVWLLV